MREPTPNQQRAILRELTRSTLVHAKLATSGHPGLMQDVIQATLCEFRTAIRRSNWQPSKLTPYRDATFQIDHLFVHFVVNRWTQELSPAWGL